MVNFVNDLGLRREVLVWRDRWFLNVHREYGLLRGDLSPKLDLALSALDDGHITKKLRDLLQNVIFPMLDSQEGIKRRSILINARAELHDIYQSHTSHNRERTSLPALIYADDNNPWEKHPAFPDLLNPSFFERLNTYTHAKTCRQAVKKIVDDLVFGDGAPNSPSCRVRLIGAIDEAAKEALKDV